MTQRKQYFIVIGDNQSVECVNDSFIAAQRDARNYVTRNRGSARIALVLMHLEPEKGIRVIKLAERYPEFRKEARKN